jgi:hypothetical protein
MRYHSSDFSTRCRMLELSNEASSQERYQTNAISKGKEYEASSQERYQVNAISKGKEYEASALETSAVESA